MNLQFVNKFFSECTKAYSKGEVEEELVNVVLLYDGVEYEFSDFVACRGETESKLVIQLRSVVSGLS